MLLLLLLLLLPLLLLQHYYCFESFHPTVVILNIIYSEAAHCARSYLRSNSFMELHAPVHLSFTLHQHL